MMRRAWHHAALTIDEIVIRLGNLEYVARCHPDAFDQSEYDRAVEDARSWLYSVRDAIDRQLAELPPPVPPPEKSCGHISESVHA